MRMFQFFPVATNDHEIHSNQLMCIKI